MLIGVAVGLPIAWWLARLTSSQISAMLFDVTPVDPVMIAAATGVLILVAMGAGWLPARRAARIDPVIALRTRIGSRPTKSLSRGQGHLIDEFLRQLDALKPAARPAISASRAS